jgi:hypothetical protein
VPHRSRDKSCGERKRVRMISAGRSLFSDWLVGIYNDLERTDDTSH